MKLLTFPELRQFSNYDCGACALQAVLAYYNIDIKESEIIKRANTTEEGTNIEDIIRVAKEEGITSISKQMTIKELIEYIEKNIPVVIALQARNDDKNINWKEARDDGHYAVAIGYDENNIYFEDPSSFKRTVLSYQELEDRRHDISREWEIYDHHGIAFLGKNPSFKLNNFEHMD